MTSHEHEPMLPRVEEADLLLLVFDEITDPVHSQRWKELAASNPVLANELLKVTLARAREISDSNPLEVQKFAVDTVTFALKALETALKRLRDANDGVVVEDQQP